MGNYNNGNLKNGQVSVSWATWLADHLSEMDIYTGIYVTA